MGMLSSPTTMGTSMNSPRKLDTCASSGPAVPLLDIYPKNSSLIHLGKCIDLRITILAKTYQFQRDTYLCVFLSVGFSLVDT